MKTTSYFNDQILAIEVWTRILHDIQPKNVNIIYLFGQTKDNQTSVLNVGAKLWLANKNSILLIDEGTILNGYPGYKIWFKELTKRGIPSESIKPLKIDGDLNTLTESTALVKYAESSGKKNILIISPPFHQARAFITLIGVLKKMRVKLKVYNKCGEALDWNEVVFHSQGILKNTRKGLISDEIKRIEKYHKRGNLASLEKIKNYLDKRG